MRRKVIREWKRKKGKGRKETRREEKRGEVELERLSGEWIRNL